MYISTLKITKPHTYVFEYVYVCIEISYDGGGMTVVTNIYTKHYAFVVNLCTNIYVCLCINLRRFIIQEAAYFVLCCNAKASRSGIYQYTCIYM